MSTKTRRRHRPSHPRQPVTSLFQFVNETPEAFIDDLIQDDPFLFTLHDLVSQAVADWMPSVNVEQLRADVSDIDDSGHIEVQAFKVGFLFGLEYAKRQERAK